MTKEDRRKLKNFKEHVKKNKGLTVLYFMLRLSIVLVMVAQIFNKDWNNVFLCGLSLFLMIIPSFVEDNFHIDIPDTLEVVVILFIYAAEILGEIHSFYIHIKIWDSMLHITTGFLAAAVGFTLCDIINRVDSKKFNLSPFYLTFCAFCFSMTVAVLWEFLEFSLDYFLGFDTQKDSILNTVRTVYLDSTKTNTVVEISNITKTVIYGDTVHVIDGYLDIGLMDTMKDMFVNFVGAVVFSFIGYFYVKNRSGRFAKRFIPTVKFEKFAEKNRLAEIKKQEDKEEKDK